jgi:HlyD family secretion protein
MKEGLFRKKALDSLSSPDQLDQMLRLIRFRWWFLLASCAFLLACLGAWGFFGSIPSDVYGQGVLLRNGSLYSVYAPAGGTLKRLSVWAGKAVRENEWVAEIEQTDLRDQIQEAERELVSLNLLERRQRDRNARKVDFSGRQYDQRRDSL